MVYIFLICCFYAEYIAYECINKTYKISLNILNSLFCKSFFLIISLIVGFRSLNVGVDTLTYSILYEELTRLSFSDIFTNFFHEAIEVGYVLLMKICSIICPSYYFFQLTVALITYYLISDFIFKNSKYVRIATLVILSTGLFYASFNVARQILAVAIVASMYTNIVRKKYLISTILGFISISIHVSSIIPIIICCACFLCQNNKVLKILPIVILSFTLFADIFLNMFFVLTGEKYGTYMMNTREIQSAGLIKVCWFLELCMALYISCFSKTDINSRQIGILAMFFIAFNIVGLRINYAERLGLYFLPFLAILFDRFFRKVSNKHIRKLINLFWIGLFTITFILASNGSQLTYHTFF